MGETVLRGGVAKDSSFLPGTHLLLEPAGFARGVGPQSEVTIFYQTQFLIVMFAEVNQWATSSCQWLELAEEPSQMEFNGATGPSKWLACGRTPPAAVK